MSQQPAHNEPSLLLSSEENEMVFAALGNRRITKATAVVQLFHAHPDPHKWTKYKTGVACFVKDNLRKSYYIRLLEMNSKGCSMVWEQELYNQFNYVKDLPRFHHFPGDKFMVGLNFASDKEADKFNSAMETKIRDRQHRRQTLRQKKDNTFVRTTSPSNPAPPVPPSSSHTFQPPPPQRSSPMPTISEPVHNVPVSSNKAQSKGKRKKINKSDISGPSNFQHLAHVGWDPNTGAFDSNNIDAAWKNLFDTIGVSDADLKDENTAKFIYDFVEQQGGIEKANEQLEAERQKKPPPPPSHSGGRSRGGPAPPPPPPHANRGAPPPPNRNAPPIPPSHGHAPPPPSRSAPPPPPSRHGGGSVPAPPPPPPVNAPAPPPPPAIASGGGGSAPPPPSQSHKPPPSNLPVVSDARANLMESIRAGKTLHKVEEQSPSEKKETGDGIAGALARALASRKDVIADTDSSDDEGEYDEEDDDWSD